ncbi:GNAT family N-acetyltransferase [Leekyejoonella antrihumi]|uniref:GNAT family N-acetyltransferase n=1 Tax=Leekyejoonella antrihumi TaxID=1660198 RepID=UPI0016484E2A|nr:GNAT family N-acetyltransferase [Leekyejoonella antrihumi]
MPVEPASDLPDDKWTVQVGRSAVEALDRAQPLIAADAVRHSVFATVTAALVDEPERHKDPCWFFLGRGRGVDAVAMHTPPQALHVSTHVPGATQELATFVAETAQPIPGVGGDRAAVEAFLDRYTAITGRTGFAVEGKGVFDLPSEPELSRAVPGDYLVAGEDHLGLATAWVRAFKADIGTPCDGTERSLVGRHIAAGRLGLWLANGVPVAMCWASTSHAGVVRISGVYTPSELRGHGYASAVVCAASRRQQDLGHRCMLYTQLSNPTSNKIYQAMGYRRVGDDLQVQFDAPEAR